MFCLAHMGFWGLGNSTRNSRYLVSFEILERVRLYQPTFLHSSDEIDLMGSGSLQMGPMLSFVFSSTYDPCLSYVTLPGHLSIFWDALLHLKAFLWCLFWLIETFLDCYVNLGKPEPCAKFFICALGWVVSKISNTNVLAMHLKSQLEREGPQVISTCSELS